jgi:hypothetical protein
MLSVLATSNIVTGSSQRYTTLSTFAALLLPFAIALLDVGLSVCRRWITGRKIFLPDADHIHHRIMEMFQRPRLVVGTFYIFSVLLCTLALLIAMRPESYSGLVVGSLSVFVLIAAMAGVLKLYRVERITEVIKIRNDCMFLSTFNNYMKMRVERAKYLDELVVLLESGVRDLNFDRVEVSMNGFAPRVWSNFREAHPESPKKNGHRALRGSDVLVRWVVPTHDDPDYQKYLETVWWQLLSQVEERHRELNGADASADEKSGGGRPCL